MLQPSHEIPLLFAARQRVLEDDCACAPATMLSVSEASGLSEQDCACPTSLGRRVSAVQADARYRQAEEVWSQNLAGDFHLVFHPRAPQGPCVLNTAAWKRWQDFQIPQPLSQPIDHQLAEQRLLLPLDLPAPSAPQPDTLMVWLHVTNQCNLRCAYCYVNKNAASMSQEIGEQAIRRVMENAVEHHFVAVKLKYAGGEPSLNFPLIRHLAIQAQREAEAHHLRLEQVVLSNGTHLRPEDAKWLHHHGVRLMISLDGIGEIHDRLRPYRGGKGSFATVSNTIEKILLPSGLIPTISITVTRYNAHGIAEAVRWALERNLPVSLNFYRQPFGAPEDLAAEEQMIIQGMLAAYRVFEEFLPTDPFLSGLLDRAQATEHQHPCAAGISYLVITHEGKLAQCQMLLDRPVSDHLQGDLILKVRNGPLRNLSVDQKEQCHTCTYRYFCAGGCPLETFRTKGKWNAPSPNCRIYQALFPEALRLEGLRLLKLHGLLN